MDTVSRRPETVATRAGLRLYDVPPGKYPEETEGMLGKGAIPGTPKKQFYSNKLVKLNVSHVKMWKHPIETQAVVQKGCFRFQGSCHS